MYMYMKYHNNQSLFTWLNSHSLTVILVFITFSSVSFEIRYRTQAVVGQNILKITLQCPALILLWKG